MALVTNNRVLRQRLAKKEFSASCGQEIDGATKTFTNSIVIHSSHGSGLVRKRDRLLQAAGIDRRGLETDALSVELYRQERILINGLWNWRGRWPDSCSPRLRNQSRFHSGAAFRHGPVELLNDRPVVMTMNPSGETAALMEELHEISAEMRTDNSDHFQSACERSIRVSVKASRSSPDSQWPSFKDRQRAGVETASILERAYSARGDGQRIRSYRLSSYVLILTWINPVQNRQCVSFSTSFPYSSSPF